MAGVASLLQQLGGAMQKEDGQPAQDVTKRRVIQHHFS
jgi:hypothetical protein